MPPPAVQEVLRAINLDSIQRITASLEGNWSASVVEVWLRERGRLGFAQVVDSHPVHRPGLELDLGAVWIGIPCYVRKRGLNVFDETLAAEIIRLVESASQNDRRGRGNELTPKKTECHS